MVSFIFTYSLVSTLVASTIAGPVAVHIPSAPFVLVERIPSIPLGSYDLTTSHVDDVLFNIGAGITSAQVGDAYDLIVECVDCRTWGSAVLSTSGVHKKENVIGDIIDFFKNPVDAVTEAFSLDVKIDFQDVGGHFDFNIQAAHTASYSVPIFQSGTAAGIAVSEDVTLGLVLFIDLVFSLTAEIDLEAGFEFEFPEGAYLTVDPISGDIVDHSFTGAEVDNLPVTVTSGSATFKAALRVRIQAGTTVEVFGTGFDFELAIFADLIEYVATIGTDDQCELYITESIDINVGAYAHAVVEIDWKALGASPNVVTTLVDYPLPSLCLTRPHITTSTTALPTSSSTVTTTSSTSFTSGSVISTSYATPSSTSTYSNATITSTPSLTTSTVISTDIITITSCSSTVLHCPASLTSEIVITSTKILYTTICPVGAILPTTTPAPVSAAITKIVSPIAPTTYATLVVETIYSTTFINPTYTMPTATIFTVLNPSFTAAPSAILPSAPIKVATTAGAVGNGTVSTGTAGGPAGPTSSVSFTGGSERLGSSAAALVMVLFVGTFIL